MESDISYNKHILNQYGGNNVISNQKTYLAFFPFTSSVKKSGNSVISVFPFKYYFLSQTISVSC
jgi:hypothetical protein